METVSAAGGDANRGTRSRPVTGRGHVVCVERHHAVPSSPSARSAGECRAAHAGVAARRGGIRDQHSAGVQRAVGRELAFEFLVLTATRMGEVRSFVAQERLDQVREIYGEEAYQNRKRAWERASQPLVPSRFPSHDRPQRRGPERGGPERDSGPSR